MPYRHFTDSHGTGWQVWDIVPQLSERRGLLPAERRGTDVEVPIDRREEPRRMTDSRRSVLRGSYAQGWLCFESDGEKCRLSPIPADWLTCSDEELESYFRSGERVSGAYRLVTDSSSSAESIAEAG